MKKILLIIISISSITVSNTMLCMKRQRSISAPETLKPLFTFVSTENEKVNLDLELARSYSPILDTYCSDFSKQNQGNTIIPHWYFQKSNKTYGTKKNIEDFTQLIQKMNVIKTTHQEHLHIPRLVKTIIGKKNQSLTSLIDLADTFNVTPLTQALRIVIARTLQKELFTKQGGTLKTAEFIDNLSLSQQPIIGSILIRSNFALFSALYTLPFIKQYKTHGKTTAIYHSPPYTFIKTEKSGLIYNQTNNEIIKIHSLQKKIAINTNKTSTVMPDRDNQLKITAIDTHVPIILSGHRNKPYLFTFGTYKTPDDIIFSQSKTEKIIWTAKNGKILFTLQSTPKTNINTKKHKKISLPCTIADEKQTVNITKKHPKSAFIWNPNNSKERLKLSHEKMIENIDVTPDGSIIFTTYGKNLFVWQLGKLDTFTRSFSLQTILAILFLSQRPNTTIHQYTYWSDEKNKIESPLYEGWKNMPSETQDLLKKCHGVKIIKE